MGGGRLAWRPYASPPPLTSPPFLLPPPSSPFPPQPRPRLVAALHGPGVCALAVAVGAWHMAAVVEEQARGGRAGGSMHVNAARAPGDRGPPPLFSVRLASLALFALFARLWYVITPGCVPL